MTIHIKTAEQFSFLVVLYVAKDVFDFDSVYELKNATTQRQTLKEDLTRCYKLCYARSLVMFSIHLLLLGLKSSFLHYDLLRIS